MVINASSSFRRYTPPTCTLEIYHPQSFWGYFGPKPFPQLFSFQLHFDDPRVPKEDRTTIIGDRDLLEKLRTKVQDYINNYLKTTHITEEDLICELPSDNEEEFISLTRDYMRGHRLFYHCFVPKEEILEVTLSNTQLLDFINALSAYHLDATKMTINKDESASKSNNIGLGIIVTTLACLVGGGIWWRYERQLATNEVNNSSQANIETVTPNVEKLIPPSPLDPKTLPSIVAPEVPESLKNRETLLPPATITKPPTQNDSLNNNNSGVASQTQIIIPPPPNPSVVNIPRVENQGINPANIMTIQPSLPEAPSSPITPTPSFQPPQPTVKSIPQYPSRLSSLPVLKSSNSDSQENSLPNTTTKPITPPSVGINSLNSVSSSVIENTPDFTANQISPSLNQQKFAGIITNEVKQYFQGKWQPPENLKQSIEYRLNFNQNGSLTKITPVGQVAIVFLDRTGMPLLGEKLTSSFTQTDELTVRLILSPNGNVQTFNESK